MATAELEDFTYDPFSVQVMSDPLPYYPILRDHFPVYYVPRYDLFALSRFADVSEMLERTDDTFLSTEGSLPSVDRLLAHNDGPVPDPSTAPMASHTGFSSEVHTSVRQAYGRSLRPKPVARMEGFIRDLVTERLDALLPTGEFDLVQDFSGIVSASVTASLWRLGLDTAPAILQTVNEATQSDQVKGGIDYKKISTEMTAVVRPAVEQRRTEGADGSFPMVDGMLDFRIDGRALTDQEIAEQYVCASVGATETLPKLFAHGLMELQRRPDQLAAVRADVEANVPIAFEEMLRFCGPAQWFLRTVRKPVTIHGQEISPGQRVIGLIQSGNRDPREFDDPDEFVWNREIPRTLAFGRGPHFCIGVHVARLEGRIMLEEWLRRVPDFHIDEAQAFRRPSSFQWGYSRMPVTIGG